MRVAIIHDWLVDFGGAEVVLKNILEIYPDADLFTTVDFLADEDRNFLNDVKITKTWLQSIPYISRLYRFFMPLMFSAVEQFDLTEYDLIISSSHAVAKNVIISPEQTHICYCHSPMRYAWDMSFEYRAKLNLARFSLKKFLINRLLVQARYLDLASSFRVDYFIANSSYIQKRIMKCYRRSSIVLHPPCPQIGVTSAEQPEEYFFTCSRLVAYKNVDLIARAFGELHPDLVLKIAGDGPDRKVIEKLANKFRNVEYLGRVSEAQKASLLRKAKAFVYAAKEDFGIVPVEAQSCGTPVIAYGVGGIVDTVASIGETSPTGVLFESQTIESLSNGINKFINTADKKWRLNAIENSKQFSSEKFKKNFSDYVSKVI